MANQQRPLSAPRKVNRRRSPVRFRVLLRRIQYVGGVRVIVVRPIGHGPQRRARREHIRLCEHRHQRDEAAIAAAVHADPSSGRRRAAPPSTCRVHFVVQILAAHVLVDRRAPVPPISRRSRGNRRRSPGPALHQQVVKHVLAGIVVHHVHILQIPRAMHEDHRRPALLEFRRLVQPRPQHRPITRLVRDNEQAWYSDRKAIQV